MSWSGLLAVGGGAAVGAWLRWGLGIALNPVFPTVPLGTLTANLIGGLLIGFAMELLTRHAVLPPEMRFRVDQADTMMCVRLFTALADDAVSWAA